ncbi:unnamed protein product, partial [Medioppia subpectinata]
MSPKLSKPLSPGDVITEDMPIIHIIHNEYKDKYCDNCMKRSDQLKKCSKCLHMYYCSKECQKNDWKYHKNECPLYGRDLTSKLSTDNSVRIRLRLYLSVQKIPNFATKKYRLFDGSDVSLNDIAVKDNCLKQKQIREELDVFCKYFRAVGIDYERQEVLHWLSFLWTIPLLPIKSSDQEMPDPIGSGLYMQYSLLGHSCQPNSAIIVSKELSIQLRAMRPIAAGEDITISHIPLDLNRADRRKELAFWSIVCECDKCVHHLDRNIDYTRLRPSNLFPLNVFTFGTQLSDYLREVLNQLNIVFGVYHPQKTILLMAIVNKLSDCPLIPESVLNEMKADLMKAIDVTLLADNPLRILGIHRLTTVSLRDIKVRDKEVNVDGLVDYIEFVSQGLRRLHLRNDRQEVRHWFTFMYTIPLIAIKSSNVSQIGVSHVGDGGIGRGLYMQYSLLGHSCQPNSAFVFNDQTKSMELRAMRPIGAGEEITISYIQIYKTRARRQRELQWLTIVCECDKCVHHLDRRVDYQASKVIRFWPSREFSSAAQVMHCLREVMDELDVIFGDFHPQKTCLILRVVKKLFHCPERVVPETLFDEMKANLMKAIDVTFLADCPLSGRSPKTLTIDQLSAIEK